MAAVHDPQTHIREAAVRLSSVAMLVIDMQNFCMSREGACHSSAHEQDRPSEEYFWNQLENTVVPNIAQLQAACRQHSVEVVFTVIESLTQNGRDRGLDYKISGFNVPHGCWDAKVIDALAPQGDEICIPKTSSSVFISTNMHYVLQNLGIKYLIICGGYTDQCVESAVRDACDLGYYVTLVTDACVTVTPERHANSLSAISGYCRQRKTGEMMEEIERLGAKRKKVSDNKRVSFDEDNLLSSRTSSRGVPLGIHKGGHHGDNTGGHHPHALARVPGGLGLFAAARLQGDDEPVFLAAVCAVVVFAVGTAFGHWLGSRPRYR